MSETTNEILAQLGRLEQRCDEGCGSSKKVPAGIILALLVQTFTVIWWAAGVHQDLRQLQQEPYVVETEVQNFIAAREKVYMEMDNKRHLDITERAVRIESSFLFIEKALTRIEKKLMLIGTEAVK